MCRRYEQMRLILAIIICASALTYLTMFMEGMETQCCRKVFEINRRIAELTGAGGGGYITSDYSFNDINTTNIIAEDDEAAFMGKLNNENHIRATLGNVSANTI